MGYWFFSSFSVVVIVVTMIAIEPATRTAHKYTVRCPLPCCLNLRHLNPKYYGDNCQYNAGLDTVMLTIPLTLFLLVYTQRIQTNFQGSCLD